VQLAFDDHGVEHVARVVHRCLGLLRERDVGDVTAVAADENIVFYARLMRRAPTCFCIHALFRNALLARAAAAYNRNRQPLKARLFGKFVLLNASPVEDRGTMGNGKEPSSLLRQGEE
jgi:hypothetical protein